MTNLEEHIKKQRHYFANKGPSSHGYGFSSGHVWMWELDCEESWVPKNWCFWTMVLEKTLESPLDCKEIQPVLPKGISPGCSLKGLMLKLKLQYFGHLMQRIECEELTFQWRSFHWKRPCCWERLKVGGEGNNRGWDGWMRWLDVITNSVDTWTWVWVNPGSWWTGKPGILQSMGSQRVWRDWVTELNQSEKTQENVKCKYLTLFINNNG